MPPVDKQLLLEEADERERLQALAGSLRRLHSGLLRARRDANHARSNGHKPGTIPKIEWPRGPCRFSDEAASPLIKEEVADAARWPRGRR